MFLIAAGALAVGYASARVLDLHSHQCDRCKRTWSHLGAFNLGDERAHTCPACGAMQWWKTSTPAGMREAYEAAHQPQQHPQIEADHLGTRWADMTVRAGAVGAAR